MNADNPVLFLVAAALVGAFGGFGLVIGAFVARSLRRYMSDEGLKPYGNNHHHRPPPEEEP